MAKKPNPLQAALNAVEPANTQETPDPTQTDQKRPASARRQDRQDKVLIGGHFPKAVRQQLRMIAAEDDTTTQALLSEALNLLFVKKGKDQIA